MAIKNMAASVLTRLKNQSKEEGIPFQMVLQLFAQEEFLRKLSLSDRNLTFFRFKTSHSSDRKLNISPIQN